MSNGKRVALITGGVGGVGRAVARRLLESGYTVVLADLDRNGSREVADSIGCEFAPVDVTHQASMNAAVEQVEAKHGRLDLVHLNAGITAGWRPFHEIPSEEYQQVVDVNVHGVVFGVLASAPALARAGGGSIVVTASLAGLTQSRDPYYALAKAAAVGFVRSAAPQLAEQKITINALCPSFIDTPLVAEELRSSGYPMLQPDDVARATMRLLDSGGTGEAWLIQVGHEPQPYRFRGVPGARLADGTTAQLP
ncbi:SDR family NAD(P)-dependent oxidoreductase [Saccharopolyspora shandongensis]|uniref:SDR family NAD(P)-dependent oxidoreductase n=1 Tax=Saccharopolyspora shandongensis TaxID=418495 RepID=UPI0033D9DAE8